MAMHAGKRARSALAVVALAAVLMAPAAAFAQEWPARPIHMVVAFTPGGAVDIVARLVAEQLSKRLKQPVIVENRPGGGGIVGADFVAKAVPDGYTFGHLSGASVVNLPLLNSRIPYAVDRDFIPVSMVQITEQILVARPDFQASNVADLVQLAKAQPGKVSFAYTGVGTANHLAGVTLESMDGIKLLKVTYKGEAPVLTDLMGGHVDIAVASVAATLPLLQTGKIKVIASLGDKRPLLLPDLATVAEQGYPRFNTGNSFRGISAPRATPPAIVASMSKAVRDVLQDPELRKQLMAQGGAPMGTTREAYAAWLAEETQRSRVAIRDGAVRFEE